MFHEDLIKGILLVVTDSEERERLRQLFLGEGYEVHLADEAAEALAQVSTRLIPLVICDLQLGRFSGVDLLTEIKAHHPAIPVVMLCDEDDIAGAVSAMQAGALDCLTKPYHDERLVELVEASVVMKIHDTVMFDRTAKQIAGYKIICKIGDGSMGVVYLAQQGRERFAMKLLRVPPEEEDHVHELRERFMREAKYASDIDDPHVVHIVEFGMAGEDERPFIVMDLLEGVTLGEVMTRRPNLTYLQQAALLRQIAQALAAIHATGICHRDIKPTNVMVDDALHATVMDFGLVYMPDSELTLTEELLGSPAYLAPEAFKSPAIDQRGDLFSFGVLAYEFLLGELPFYADDIAGTMMKITMDRPVAPRRLQPGFPVALENLLARLLKKQPAERIQTASDVIRELDAFLTNPAADVVCTSIIGVDWKEPPD